MKEFTYNFEKNRTYLLACSYGPDSMALYDMLRKKGCNFVACFVNYHKRDISNKEQEDLTLYCKKNNVRLEILDTASLTQDNDNFQEWAREVRYKFFEDMYKKYNAVGVFVAHHQDDLIETFIMQKMRKTHVKQYGLNEITMMDDLLVIRPLLMYSKQDLLEYCKENLVPYSIDESNFETIYLRNQIRKEIVSKMSEIDRENVLREIHDLNMEQTAFKESVENKIKIGDELEIRELIALDPNEFAEVLLRFVDNAPKHIDLSNGCIQEIRKMCLSTTPNVSMKIGDGVYIVKEYDIITLGIDELNDLKEYSYTLDKPGVLSTPEFDLDFTMGAEERKIHLEDYPLTIRSPLPGDEYEVGHHMCEIRRVFIDWKVPAKYRKVWPMFINKDGKIIYVPRYRKTFVDNHKSKFIIKFTNTKEIK